MAFSSQAFRSASLCHRTIRGLFGFRFLKDLRTLEVFLDSRQCFHSPRCQLLFVRSTPREVGSFWIPNRWRAKRPASRRPFAELGRDSLMTFYHRRDISAVEFRSSQL